MVRGPGHHLFSVYLCVRVAEDEDVRRLLWLYTVQDEGIAPLARWLFTFLSAKSQDIFDRLLALGLYDCVVHSLENEIQSASCLSASMDSATVSILSTAHKDNADEEGQLAAIRCLGNLCAGSEVCAHAALHHPALPTKLVVCLDSALYSKWVAKEALRTLSYLLNGASEAQQQHTLGGVINEFMTAWHRNVLSEDHDAQEASLLAIESLHPSLSLSFYEEKDAKTLDDILYTLVKLVLSPTTATLCQIAVLALLKTWLGYRPAVVAPRLVQMDVAESLENLHVSEQILWKEDAALCTVHGLMSDKMCCTVYQQGGSSDGVGARSNRRLVQVHGRRRRAGRQRAEGRSRGERGQDGV